MTNATKGDRRQPNRTVGIVGASEITQVYRSCDGCTKRVNVRLE